MQEFILITVGAALGANARYWVATWVAERYGATFPWSTLLINVSGSLLIGLAPAVLGQRMITDPAYRLLVVTGFLGAYTTFSTFSYETLALAQRGDYLHAALNAAGSVALGLLATFVGILLGRWLA